MPVDDVLLSLLQSVIEDLRMFTGPHPIQYTYGMSTVKPLVHWDW